MVETTGGEGDSRVEALCARLTRRDVIRGVAGTGIALSIAGFSRPGALAQDVSPTAGPPIKVAFVYVSPVGDLGWTWAHDQGRLALEQTLPNVE
ncbi:MAG: hypothetical protein M3R02_23695, partial [Chloroflexota bacterium]|nr:hypothetical protein [Chloroflexota bacterium]